jgi:hypothetical protein
MIPLLLLLTLSLFVGAPVDAADLPEDDDPEWRIEQVNEGELHFLLQPPPRPVHHHQNRINIISSSLEEGWVMLEQCHEHLDAVPELEILYHPERIRGIRILESAGIGSSRVLGHRVQLQDVGPGARLCLRAESRALKRRPEGGWLLQNGPYMRRFLDGFYPMRMSLEIRYPPQLLRLVEREPQPQPGFRLHERPGFIEADAWFEGRLFTRFSFRPAAAEQ